MDKFRKENSNERKKGSSDKTGTEINSNGEKKGEEIVSARYR